MEEDSSHLGAKKRIITIILVSVFSIFGAFSVAEEKEPDEKINNTTKEQVLESFNSLETFIPKERLKEPYELLGNGSCMSWAARRSGLPLHGSAYDIWKRAGSLGLNTTSTPLLGSVLVTLEGPIGHVVVVEEVMEDSVRISEQNYVGSYIVSGRIIEMDYELIVGYIY